MTCWIAPLETTFQCLGAVTLNAKVALRSAVLLRVGVRFVAGVDDRSFEGRLETDLDLEEVRALGELETLDLPVLAHAEPACSRDHLSADEEGDHC